MAQTQSTILPAVITHTQEGDKKGHKQRQLETGGPGDAEHAHSHREGIETTLLQGEACHMVCPIKHSHLTSPLTHPLI